MQNLLQIDYDMSVIYNNFVDIVAVLLSRRSNHAYCSRFNFI